MLLMASSTLTVELTQVLHCTLGDSCRDVGVGAEAWKSCSKCSDQRFIWSVSFSPASSDLSLFHSGNVRYRRCCRCRDFLLFIMFTHARLMRCSNVWLPSVELESLTELVFYCSYFPRSLLLPFYAPQFSSMLLQQSKLFAKCATFFFAFLMAVHCSSGQPLSETSVARVPSSSTNDIFTAGFSSRRVPNLRPSLYSYRWIRAMHSRISPITRMKIFTSGSVDLIFIISITTQLRTLVAQLAAKRERNGNDHSRHCHRILQTAHHSAPRS